MKKKFLIMTMACMLAVAFGAGVYADSNLEQISSYLNHGLHFKLNGQEWKPASTPITYDGTTYLPVRSAADAAGLQVGYDNDTQTVLLDSPSGKPSISYAFTQAGDHPENVLVNVIGEAKEKLDIAIYSITLPAVVQAIIDAHDRGVAVRMISDKTEAGTKSQSFALNKLSAAGIPIKINKHSGLMHLKVTIVDGKLFTTGSFNYSDSASTRNDEVLLVIRDPTTAAKWDEQFERMWKDTTGFVDFTAAGMETTNDNTTAGGEASTTGTYPQSNDVHYASCKDVKAAGKAPLHRGDPGYSAALDRDGDGIACET